MLYFMKSTKYEIRNTKQIQNSNAQIFKTDIQKTFWSFEFGLLDIVSDFDIRISDLAGPWWHP